MTSVIDCRTRPMDLSAQKLISPSRLVAATSYKSNLCSDAKQVKSRGRHDGLRYTDWYCTDRHLGPRCTRVRGTWMDTSPTHRRRVRHHLADRRARRSPASRTQV